MEEWKDVVGYEGLYEVSNLGRVRSLYKNKILKQTYNACGYYKVNLYKDGVQKSKTVHRIVAESWIPQVDSHKDQVNHKNEIKTDNRVENLEWCTVNYNNAYGTHNDRVYDTLVNKGYIKHPERRYLSDYKKKSLYYKENRDRIIIATKRSQAKRRVKEILSQGREVPLWGKVIG